MNAVKEMPRQKKRGRFGKRRGSSTLSAEDVIIIAALEQLKSDLDLIHRTLDVVTDPILIDSFIYEMNAKNMRYQYYLRICKDKGLIGDIFCEELN